MLEDKLPLAAPTAGGQCPPHESPIYQDELRRMTLKRKRDKPLDPALYESVNVTVWEQRLYVSIITNNRVTTVSEFAKRSDGRPGEVEATGQVRVGDIISQINGHHVAGLDSASVSGRIKSAGRPLVIVFLRPRVGHQPQDRAASRAEDVRESESRAEAHDTEAVERSHIAVATGAGSAANAVKITNPSPTSSAQPVEVAHAVNTPVPAPHFAHPAYPEAGQHSQQYNAPSYQAAPVHAYSNPPVPAPQQRYPQQQPVSQSPMQPYPAAAIQATYNALSDTQQSLRVNLALNKQQRAAIQNQWNSAYSRHQIPTVACGTSMMPVAQKPTNNSSNNYNPYLTGGHVPTSHLRPQHQAPQAAHPQQIVGSQQHANAMLQPYPPQQAQPMRNQWAITNGVILGTFSSGGYGNNVHRSSSRSSAAAPARTRTSEYNNRSNVVDYRSTQPAAASVTAQGVMPAHQYAPSSSSSQQQQPRPGDDQYYNSAATASSEPGFGTSESRFTEVELSQEQQNAGTAVTSAAAPEVGDDGTESDEPPAYNEPVGRFELDDDLDDEEKQLAAELGMDMSRSADLASGKSASSFLSASSVAAAAVEPATETEKEASSFLSPNKPNSFVATIPVQTIGRYQYVPPQRSHELETTLKTVNDEDCVVVEIQRTRLYVTLGQLGTWIAITSFVRGKNGEMGELEESGKVFIGDTIYAINGYPVNMEASPTDVARVVTNLPRPFKLYFQRASWDTLEGNT